MEDVSKCFEEASRFLHREVGICDEHGRVVASSTPLHDAHDYRDVVAQVMSSPDPVSAEGRLFMAINEEDVQEGIAYVLGTDKAAEEVLFLLSRWIRSARLERNTDMERQSFIKNVLLENELDSDVPLKAREYKIPYLNPRQALLLHFKDPCDTAQLEKIIELMPSSEDFVLAVDEHSVVVLLYGVEENTNKTEKIAFTLYDHFMKAGRKLKIGIGLKTKSLIDAAKSYREASLALTVGSIFQEDTDIMWYNKLGLGRLIYQLPPTLCGMFLAEVFAPDTYEALDPETLLTIDKFFDNNLNGSETSRQLFVHRNTLVYRLDKVQKITGLDLRNFDDAVLFKLASMVRKYLETLATPEEQKALRKRW